MKGKGLILVVDDDPLVTETLRAGLCEGGYKVVPFSGGQAVIDYCRQGNPYDLMLIDYDMPEINGLDTIRQLPDNQHHPFALITTYENEKLVIEASKLGALAFLRKSMGLGELLPAVYVAIICGKHRYSLKTDYIRNREVNYAVGLLAARNNISFNEAFNIIREDAKYNRIKVGEIAKKHVAAHLDKVSKS